MIILSLMFALSGAFSVLFSSVTSDALCTFMCSYIQQSTILASLHRIPLLNPVFLALDYICEPAPVPKVFTVALASNTSRTDRFFDDDSTRFPDPARLGQAYLLGFLSALLLILVLNLSNQFIASGSTSLLETDEPMASKSLTIILEGDVNFLEQIMAQICQVSDASYPTIDLDAGLPQTLTIRQPGLDAMNAAANAVFDACTSLVSTADNAGLETNASSSFAPGFSPVSETQLVDPEHASDDHGDQQAIHNDITTPPADVEQASSAAPDMPSRGALKDHVLLSKAEDDVLCSQVEEAVLSPDVGPSVKALQLRNMSSDLFSAESTPAIDRTHEALALCVTQAYSEQDYLCGKHRLAEALDLPVKPEIFAELSAVLEAEAAGNDEPSESADCGDLDLESAPAPDVLDSSTVVSERGMGVHHVQEQASLPIGVSTGGHYSRTECARPVDPNGPADLERLMGKLEKSAQERAQLLMLQQDPIISIVDPQLVPTVLQPPDSQSPPAATGPAAPSTSNGPTQDHSTPHHPTSSAKASRGRKNRQGRRR
ncbi:hypothetical protein DENSPDRAFT_870091 [Dentipellis sp. KUC8613]|nr:hypothetical protein DENSPDRAFT_870091 [Dentipellis sp. KUC8613]